MVRIEKILCPVDFFPASLRAADFAVLLGKNCGAKVLFFHVNPVSPGTYEYAIAVPGAVRPDEESSAQEVNQLVTRARESGVAAEGKLRPGDVYDEIKQAIRVISPDLIVMGTHGRRGVERWFMGSTTEKLLRHSAVPILTISTAEELPLTTARFRRILVTTDFSEGATDTLAYALSLAEQNGSQITLLHVVDKIIEGVAVDLSGWYQKPSVEGVQKQLEDLVPADARSRCDVVTRIGTGVPYRVILGFLEDEKVDLVVMSIHGKGLVDRALLGSTAERVVRGASCPVLLIPPMKNATSGSKSRGPFAA
jgi:nucleotide-binding universal stress UspA family protein